MYLYRIVLSTVLCCSVAASFAVARPTVSYAVSAQVARHASSRVWVSVSVVVIKRFGAPIRVAPSSGAAIRATAFCGDSARVLSYANGWYKVSYHHASTTRNGGSISGWVGGARVADAGHPPSYDCTDSYTFLIGQHGYSYVHSGCLSLRAYPSRHAPYNHCVANFHDYTVTNGPIEVGGEDWFGVVSRGTGAGWVAAQYLLPYRDKGGFVIYPTTQARGLR